MERDPYKAPQLEEPTRKMTLSDRSGAMRAIVSALVVAALFGTVLLVACVLVAMFVGAARV